MSKYTKHILRNILFVITHPGYWLQIYPTCTTFDRWMFNALTSNYNLVIVDSNYIKLNGIELCVENYPCAFGRTKISKVLPRALTRRMLRDAITNKILKGELEVDE